MLAPHRWFKYQMGSFFYGQRGGEIKMPRIRRDSYLIERKFPRINVVIWTRKTIEEFFKGYPR